jgi:hypothetical protein
MFYTNLKTSFITTPEIPFATIMIRIIKLFNLYLPENNNDINDFFQILSNNHKIYELCSIIYYPLEMSCLLPESNLQSNDSIPSEMSSMINLFNNTNLNSNTNSNIHLNNPLNLPSNLLEGLNDLKGIPTFEHI